MMNGKDIKAMIDDMVKQAVDSLMVPPLFIGSVKEVKDDTCTVAIAGKNEQEFTGVRLRAIVNNGKEDTLLITPKKDSMVLIADLSRGERRDLAVIQYTEVESIDVKIGETRVFIDKEGVVFNEGELKGMVKVDELVDKLNVLEDRLPSHKHTCPGATPPLSDNLTLSITQTKPEDLVNDKVTH
jgi:hypothetical protein